MKTSVSPSDCAIAVGVALTRDHFVQRFLAAEEGSFIYENMIVGSTRTRDPDAAWRRWSDTAARIETGLRCVERMGVRVRREARLTDIVALMDSYEVVTIFSHWRSAIFRSTDLCDAQALSQSLGDPRHALHCAVEEWSGSPARGIEPLAELNRALFKGGIDAPVRDSSLVRPGRLSELQTLWHERRLHLESCAPRLFRGGASIEFADGLKTVESIVALIPTGFDKLLDLTVCTCVLMAMRVKQKAPGCYVACNELLTYPLPRMLIYQHVMKLLSKRPGSFEEAVFKVRTLIQSEVNHERNRQIAGSLSRRRAFR
ncbi:hypothetical protein [Paraburkholderia aromaticivorans]|uniref:hypothetical protein n=1 Tax=Paraburkholderia aromaticivorans TaxID=2026199 RepID=UPI0014560826|nr:hypothetical protein [Paraburkholderia aromaticivorans]